MTISQPNTKKGNTMTIFYTSFYKTDNKTTQNFKVFDTDEKVIATGQVHHQTGQGWVLDAENKYPPTTFKIPKRPDFDPDNESHLEQLPSNEIIADALGINQEDDKDLPLEGERTREVAFGDTC